jgi:hypothetical protein
MTWRQRTGNKYHAESCTYNGILYASKKEAGYAAELNLRLKAGDIADWERQFEISLDGPGGHICNHYVDFKIYHKDGSVELVEIKGFATEVWRLKRLMLERLFLPEHPDWKYTVIF